jgi:hypothetical protein
MFRNRSASKLVIQILYGNALNQKQPLGFVPLPNLQDRRSHFKRISDRWDRMTTGVCVYLTDGYGTFPQQSRELPVLWVVIPGGLDLSEFPFGETVHLLSV